jgi:hypothetical protein
MDKDVVPIRPMNKSYTNAPKSLFILTLIAI